MKLTIEVTPTEQGQNALQTQMDLVSGTLARNVLEDRSFDASHVEMGRLQGPDWFECSCCATVGDLVLLS